MSTEHPSTDQQPTESHDSSTGPRKRSRRRVVLTAAAATALTAGALLGVAGIANAAPSTGSAAGSSACDDGAWQVAGASVQGAPAGFAAGDAGRTYLRHDTGGWHLRTTDVTSGPHHYSGTIVASPGAAFTDVAKVKLDPGDQLYVDGHNTLHYAFTTHAGVDGVNFRVTACSADRAHERLTFALHGNGFGDNPAGIDLGSGRSHPAGDPFAARRTT